MGCTRLDTGFLFFLEVETSGERARTQKKDLNVYPFGLKHKGYNNTPIAGQRDHKYGFGGKEEQNELGLDWIDITARSYDPALGRWMNLDPLAEHMRRHSPYNYAFDNPIYFTDPDGMAPSGPGDGWFRRAWSEVKSWFSPDKPLNDNNVNLMIGEQTIQYMIEEENSSSSIRLSRDNVPAVTIGLDFNFGSKSFTPFESTVTPSASVTAGSAGFGLAFGVDNSGLTNNNPIYNVNALSASYDTNIAGIQVAKANGSFFNYDGSTSLNNFESTSKIGMLNSSSMTVIPTKNDDLTGTFRAAAAYITINATEAINNLRDASNSVSRWLRATTNSYFNQNNPSGENINPL